MDELTPRRDAKKFWNDPEMLGKVDSPITMIDVTGLSGENKSSKLNDEYFKKNKFIDKFVGMDRNKNGIPDILERPFKKKGGLF